jgi:hypothetical protein
MQSPPQSPPPLPPPDRGVGEAKGINSEEGVARNEGVGKGGWGWGVSRSGGGGDVEDIREFRSICWDCKKGEFSPSHVTRRQCRQVY